MSDLTATAAANDISRAGHAGGIIAGDLSGTLARFLEHAQGSAMSTNVSAAKILAFDHHQGILHSRALAIADADGDTEAGLARFAEGPWAARRTAFEDVWEGGRTSIYGALNTGGLGTEGEYGPYCLVVSDPLAGAAGIAVFPGDSAQRYTDTSAAVDTERALADATSWTHRAALTVTECGEDALNTHEAGWPGVVCRVDRYLEVIRTGHLPLTRVEAVRVRSQHKEDADELRARGALGQTLTPTEQVETAAFEAIAGWRRTMGITIEQQ